MDREHVTVKEDYIDAGAAAVNLLRTRGEVAKHHILVAGHSITPAIAPEVAPRRLRRHYPQLRATQAGKMPIELPLST